MCVCGLKMCRGSYDMLDDHLTATPLSVTLFDEHHDVAYTGRAGIPEGHFEIKNAHGKYMFCIGNGFESYHFENADEKRTEFENHRYQLYKDHHHDDDGYDVTNRDNKPRTVGFNIHVSHTTETLMKQITNSEDFTKSPLSQDLQDVIDMSNNLETMFNSLLDHQEYMKDRDETHGEYLDESLSILGKWTMVEALLLIVVSCGQILYFRRVFETQRYM